MPSARQPSILVSTARSRKCLIPSLGNDSPKDAPMSSRARIIILATALAAMVWGCGISRQGGTDRAADAVPDLQTRSIVSDGQERRYLLAAPSGSFSDGNVGVILVLHGGGGNAKQIARYLHVHDHNLARNYVVVYPEARAVRGKRNWNDGRTATQPGREGLADNDDVGFLSLLIATISAQYAVDPRRVYAMGISNGAFMANRLATETDLLAAIGPVIGSMAEATANDFAPPGTVSVLAINGVDDPLVPYEGGMVRFGRQELGMALPIRDTIALWARHNGCGADFEQRDLPERDKRDRTSLSYLRYSECPTGVSVGLYSVHGGGHTWPGASRYAPNFLVGRTSKEMDATTVLLEFFEQHPKP